MILTHEFSYHKPQKLKDALDILYDHNSCAILAGGTDLIGNLKRENYFLRDNIQMPKKLIDIKGIEKFNTMWMTEKNLIMGPLVTFTDIINSQMIIDQFPVIREMAASVASVAIRNRATVVGNICSAVPCMDSGAILSVFDAEVHLSDYCEKRIVPINKWFRGPRKTPIRANEIVTGITIPIPDKQRNYSGCYIKLGRYRGEDLAQVTCAVLVLPDNRYRVAFGAVGPVPIRAFALEKFLNGKSPKPKLIKEARELIPDMISPITDIRATKEYRLHMAQVMFERGIKIALGRFHGQGPEYGSYHL